MNKQEFVEKLESLERDSFNENYNEGYDQAVRDCLAVAKQLDEPKKVVIPKFMEDFIEDGNQFDKIAFLVHQKYLGINSIMRECPVKKWLMSVDYETVLSLVNGYEVETEQFYYVCDPTTNQYLGVDKVSTEAFWLSSQNSGARTPLTEQEIKSINESYWDFAVKVDGE
ncbi:DUF1642 domain-containing protein [Enterococcus faecalis]|uniref:DUF1642 domain-containing protein n=1 Tax=Enterococcus faecalis TaxID=1351 RepID=UPI001D17987D|nr:DUF1642 domain-containing protein [Enterococcus faecalis]MCC4084505.1 DUF1642 domain-containing protein [Enterococcus faecalis]